MEIYHYCNILLSKARSVVQKRTMYIQSAGVITKALKWELHILQRLMKVRCALVTRMTVAFVIEKNNRFRRS